MTYLTSDFTLQHQCPPQGAAVAGVFCQLNTKQGDKMDAIVICYPLVCLTSCIDLEWAFLIVLFHTPEESRAHRGLWD